MSAAVAEVHSLASLTAPPFRTAPEDRECHIRSAQALHIHSSDTPLLSHEVPPEDILQRTARKNGGTMEAALRKRAMTELAGATAG